MESQFQHTVPTGLFAELVNYERSRPPFPRELKRFADFDGVAPHLRPGPQMSLYPTMSVPEILGTRAIIASLLSREYGLSVAEVSEVLRCEEVSYAEKLIAVGDELSVNSAVVARMKEIVRRAAKTIVTEAAPAEDAAKIRVLLEGEKRESKRKAVSARPKMGTAETAQVRCVVVYFLVTEFKFTKANIRPLFGYATREELRRMECKGERYLHRCAPSSVDGKRMLRAAKAILAEADREE